MGRGVSVPDCEFRLWSATGRPGKRIGRRPLQDWPVAFTLELFVPTLGHAYAGDFDRGIAPALVTGAGVGLVA